jgi:hypothetical protein
MASQTGAEVGHSLLVSQPQVLVAATQRGVLPLQAVLFVVEH